MIAKMNLEIVIEQTLNTMQEQDHKVIGSDTPLVDNLLKLVE